MADTTFKIGKVLIEGTSVATGFISGTLTINHNVEETTAIGDSWRKGTMLGGQWEVALEFNYSPEDTALAALRTNFVAGGESCALTSIDLYEKAASCIWSGAALITGATFTKAVGAVDKLSISLQGQSTITYT